MRTLWHGQSPALSLHHALDYVSSHWLPLTVCWVTLCRHNAAPSPAMRMPGSVSYLEMLLSARMDLVQQGVPALTTSRESLEEGVSAGDGGADVSLRSADAACAMLPRREAPLDLDSARRAAAWRLAASSSLGKK